jgi:hypothetical protein
MKTLVLAILVATTTPALAWDGAGMWYSSATGGSSGTQPGGGGILGTGGQHDYGIKCTDCHVQRQIENLTFDLTFTPALTAGSYIPGTRYTVVAQLTGAQLAVPCTMPYTQNIDNFAASFEDDTGAAAGALAADDGQSAPSCTLPSPAPPGTTALDGDCKVIFANGSANLDRWTFYWTAPASGPVHVFWGAVDGDCDMMSMNDAAITGSLTLPAPPARVAPPPWVIEVAAAVARAVRT